MERLYLEMIMTLLLRVSVILAMNDSTVDNNTCWKQLQVNLPCKTALTLENICNFASSVKQHHSVNEFTSDECYPWMYYNTQQQKCECSDIPNRAVKCDAEISRTSILDCYCMTHDHGTNKTYLGRCSYGCGHKVDTVYYELPNNTNGLNNYSCGEYNRDSILCGECLPGFSPLLYSYDLKCVNCTGQSMTYNWIKYIAVAYVPLTFFFLLVVMFNFNGTSPLFKGYISISQGGFSPLAMRGFLVTRKTYIETFVRVIGCFYGIWNLDFFRTVFPPICMTHMTHLQVLALDYAIAFYPLVLILISYIFIRMHSCDVRIIVWLWKPFHKLFRLFKQNWDLEGSIVKSFATFFLLSYLKIISVTFDLLIFTEVYVITNSSKDFTTKRALYYDASIEYFGREHLPFAILALFIGTFFIIFPLVFLVVYPRKWFQVCLNALNIRRQAINVFVNCYHGYYKDGTNGTRDYRWFSVLFFVIQLGEFVLFMISRSFYVYTIGALVIMILMFLNLSIQPYKDEFKVYNIIDSFFLLILLSIFIMLIAGGVADVKASSFINFSYGCVAFLSLLPMFYFFVVGIWWLFVKKNLKKVCKCLFRDKDSLRHDSTEETDNFPHRLDNPTDYNDPSAPLLS